MRTPDPFNRRAKARDAPQARDTSSVWGYFDVASHSRHPALKLRHRGGRSRPDEARSIDEERFAQIGYQAIDLQL
jgi:hypothetical protein